TYAKTDATPSRQRSPQSQNQRKLASPRNIIVQVRRRPSLEILCRTHFFIAYQCDRVGFPETHRDACRLRKKQRFGPGQYYRSHARRDIIPTGGILVFPVVAFREFYRKRAGQHSPGAIRKPDQTPDVVLFAKARWRT